MCQNIFFSVKISKSEAPNHWSKGDSQCWALVSLPYLKFSKDHTWQKHLWLKYSWEESKQTYLLMQIGTMYKNIETRQAGLAVCLYMTILKFESPYLVLLVRYSIKCSESSDTLIRVFKFLQYNIFFL